MTYQQQVAQMRQQRRQEEVNMEYRQALFDRDEALRNRQEVEKQSVLATDPDDHAQLTQAWHYYDADVQRCEADIRRLNPPQMDQRAAQFMQERQPFIDRYGYQRAKQAWDLAHNHLMGPGNAGWKVYSPEYFRAIDTLVEMHGPQYGL